MDIPILLNYLKLKLLNYNLFPELEDEKVAKNLIQSAKNLLKKYADEGKELPKLEDAQEDKKPLATNLKEQAEEILKRELAQLEGDKPKTEKNSSEDSNQKEEISENNPPTSLLSEQETIKTQSEDNNKLEKENPHPTQTDRNSKEASTSEETTIKDNTTKKLWKKIKISHQTQLKNKSQWKL